MDPIQILKTFVAKAEATENPGEFVAIVSAFGNEDSQGDVVEKGAFEKTLAEWIIKGRPIPAVWAHQFSDPFKFIGEYTAAEETDAGLKLTGQIDLDNPTAAQVHKLMKRGLVVEFSISGLVRDYELIEDEDSDSWWPSMKIKDIDLWEAGPCFKGANDQTELLSIKSDGRLSGSLGRIRKEGRVLAQKHVDSLKEAHTKLGEVIAAAETAPADDDTAKSADPKPAEPAAKTGLTTAVRALLELSK